MVEGQSEDPIWKYMQESNYDKEMQDRLGHLIYVVRNKYIVPKEG
jgi:hypothetical protein